MLTFTAIQNKMLKKKIQLIVGGRVSNVLGVAKEQQAVAAAYYHSPVIYLFNLIL